MRHPFFTADTGAAGAAGTTNTAGAGESDAEERAAEKRFTQAELDALIKDRLERQRRAMDAQAREAQQALENQKLEDQKEFEKLAKQRAEEIGNLKPRASLAEGYEKRVSQLMLEATKELPSNIQTILNKLPLPDQLDWLTENLDSLKTPQTTNGRMNTNANARNTAAGAQQLTDEEYRAKKRREMTYQ